MNYSDLTDEQLIALKRKNYGAVPDEVLMGLKKSIPAAVTGMTAGAIGQDPSLIDKVSQVATNYKQSLPYATSPVGMLDKANSLISQGADKAGTFATEQLGKQQVNPYVSAGVGTAISMAPDIMALGNPAEGEKAPVPDAAKRMASRALGFQKRFMMTPYARGQAMKAGEVALENGVIPALGNPETALSRAKALGDKAGAELGRMRGAVGPTPLDPILDRLEEFEQNVVKGRKGGEWTAIAKKIRNAKQTVLGLEQGLSGGGVTLNDVVEAKKVLNGTTNWLSDNVSQNTTKGIVSAIEQGITDAFGEAGGDLKAYRNLKRTYGAAKSMQKALNNEVAGQTGNDIMHLSSKIAMAAAGGNPILAAANAGMMELLKRRGAGIAANLMNNAAQAQTMASPLAMALVAAKNKARK